MTARIAALGIVRASLPLAVGGFVFAFYANIQDLPIEAVRYPNLVIAITAVVCILNIGAEVRGAFAAGHDQAGQLEPSAARLRLNLGESWALYGYKALRSGGTIFLFATYAYLVPRLGFYISTGMFLPGSLLVLGGRRPINLLAFSVGITMVAFLVFSVILDVMLPPRTWGV